MSRVLALSDSSWYRELNTVAFYGETEFENIIKKHLAIIFPDFFAFSYKKEISDGSQNKKPDLALLRKDYSEWWIVEVELGSDNFEHVKGQIGTFANGQYNAVLMIDYIQRKVKEELNVDIDRAKTFELIKDNAPKILVILDRPKETWINDIHKLGGQIFIFQVYKNTSGFELYRLDGSYPFVSLKESHCKFNKVSLLEIFDPQIIDEVTDEVEIFYNDRLTRWYRCNLKERVFLRFIGGTMPLTIDPLPANQTFCLSKDSFNNFHIKAI